MRVRMLAAIVGCLGLLPVAAFASPCAGVFTDVDTTASYCAAVAFIKNKGVTTGCTGTTYCPNDYVTRAQMALFMQRLVRGGPHNILPDATSTIGGGDNNIVESTGLYATIGGGTGNAAGGSTATVAGGASNGAGGGASFVGGGTGNSAVGQNSVATGGSGNVAEGTFSAIVGGSSNIADGNTSTVAGGVFNVAHGDYSFVAGRSAEANQNGEFVWADAANEKGFDPATATHGWGDATNTFNARATGGVWFVTGLDGTGNPDTSVYVNHGSGTWSSTSDRASKENFRDVDPVEVLARIVAMPVESWNYIAEGARVRHIGPVAQDFHAAFGLGPNDTSITSIDEGGVAFAAIKGLNEKLEHENAQLRARLEAIERRLAN